MSGTTIELVNTGILMGVIHVLTGPDHLSALATLSGTSIASTTRKNCNSFLLGVRWGIGHSFGLLVVGGILIAMEQETSSEWISMDDGMRVVLESFVGVFMLGLGCYGFNKACKNRREGGVRPLSGSMTSLHPKEGQQQQQQQLLEEGRGGIPGSIEMPHNKDRRTSTEIIEQMADILNRDGDSMRDLEEDDDDIETRIFNAVESLRRNSDSLVENDDDDDENDQFMNTLKKSAKGALSHSFVKILNSKPPPMKASSMLQKHAAPENSIQVLVAPPARAPRTMRFGGRCCCGPRRRDPSDESRSQSRRCNPNILALVAGLLHGVAGPGGVLGVIPAVQLRDARLAFVYLSTFCITSTLVMGGFAAFYGSFSEWLAGGGGRRGNGSFRRGGRVFLVEVGSAFLSVAVGVIWLFLLSIGRLDDVFP